MTGRANLCPCDSGQAFISCCGKFHSGHSIPDTAEQLMRARYSAYVNCNADYLLETLHPEKHSAKLFNELKESFKDIVWSGLQIIELTDGGIGDNTGVVSFQAFYETPEGKFKMVEKSFFSKVSGQWYYKEAL